MRNVTPISQHMTFDPSISIGHVILACGFIATTIGLLLNVVALRRTLKVQRLDYLYRVTHDLFADSEFRRFFYQLDYGRFTFDADSFRESDAELHLDRLLYTYDLIGRLIRNGVVNVSDVSNVSFEISQICTNAEVRRYLDWLETEYKTHGRNSRNVRSRPFDNAQWLFERVCEP